MKIIKKMKKTILILLLIILVVIVGGPYVMGFVVEKTYKQLLAQAPTNTRMHIKLINYQRGWFNSQATLAVTLKLPPILHNEKVQSLAPTDIAFTVQENIEHGPILYGVNKNGKQSIQFGQAYMVATAEDTNINAYAHTFIEFNGRILNQIDLQQLNYHDEQQKVIYSLQNLKSNVMIADGFQQLTGYIKIGAIDFVSPDIQQQIRGLGLQYKLHKSVQGFYLGDTNAIIQSQTGMLLNKIQFKLSGMELQSNSQLLNDKINYFMDMNAKEVAVNGDSYGPFELKLDMQNLDVAALADLRKQLQVLNDETGMLNKAELRRYLSGVMKLVAKGVDVNVQKLNLTIPEGQIRAAAHLIVNPISGQINNILMLLANLNLDASLKMPKTLVQQLTADVIANERKQTAENSTSSASQSAQSTVSAEELANQQINDWLKQGVLEAADDNYQLTISFKQMQLLINGKILDGNPKNLLSKDVYSAQ